MHKGKLTELKKGSKSRVTSANYNDSHSVLDRINRLKINNYV